MRFQVQGEPPGLLVLGYVDPDPFGSVEVWYSADLETIRLQNGRLVSSVGTKPSWSGVRLEPTPPPWPDIVSLPAQYIRHRDEMPGYRFSIKEQLAVNAWHGLPPIPLSDTLPLAKARGYQWFRESAKPLAGRSGVELPDSWFALGDYNGESKIVYSQQCLAPDFCLTLQRWPLWE